jgi:hypothetical protein
MATETRTDDRRATAQQMDTQAMETQARMRGERYDPAAAAQLSRPEVREIRPAGNETKASFKTTEFYIYLASVAGVLIASAAVRTTGNHADYFRADRAWFFIVLLTIAYLVSRGLAKAGSPTRGTRK